MARRGRGLGDVLHHFIPEDEQRPRATSPSRSDDGPARWCLPLRPERPLARALARDLAAALYNDRTSARMVATFAWPEHERPRRISWHGECDVAELLAEVPEGAPVLALVRPAELVAALETAPTDWAGVLLAVEAGPRGSEGCLATLRALSEAKLTPRLAVVVVGAGAAPEAEDLYRQLAARAQHKFGLELESLGALPRDPASFRALLASESVLEVDPQAASAKSLAALGRRLGRVAA